MELQTIVVPVDNSQHSKRALEFAIALAAKAGATIHLVHGLHLPADIRMTGSWWATLRARAISELKCMIDRVEEAGVKTELHLVNEHPVAAILKLADELEADLIAMGTRGLSGAKHLLLGSATERVVRLSRCPVLTAKANTD